MKIRKAVIPAAGLGVRFLPITKALPKEMIPIVDKPAIQYIVEEAVDSGIEDIMIITGRGKGAIEDHFDRRRGLEDHLRRKDKTELLELLEETCNLANICYTRQQEPRGLGHAISCARRFVGQEPFAVLLGDDIVRSPVPCLKQMIDLYQEVQATVIGVQEVPRSEVDKYGVIDAELLRDNVYRVRDLVEKPAPEQAPSCLAVMGRYIIEPEIFDILEATEPGAGGEIQLTDALKTLAAQKPMYGLVFQGQRYDVGDKLGYLKAMVEFALARPDLAPEFQQYLKRITTGR